jgi:hypothetical protein
MSTDDRHLGMEELLALRDGEGSGFARTHVEACQDCQGEFERLNQVRAELRALPTFNPPRDLWPRVARGVGRSWAQRRFGYGLLGLAAAAALTSVIVLRGPEIEESPDVRPESWVAEASSRDLGPFIARSQELESLLRAFEPERRVYDAPTALAVSALEDRIVLIDRMLVAGKRRGVQREVLMNLWGERVDALETLVDLQVVQERDGVWR